MSSEVKVLDNPSLYVKLLNKDIEYRAIAKGGSSAKLAELEMVLRGPHNATIQTRAPVAYRNRAFQGGEAVILKGAYLGKTNNVIFKFALKSPVTDVAFLEYELIRGFESIGGLYDFSNKFIYPIFQKAVLEERQNILKAETEKYDNPLFGSW